jgi:hypothetical protein
MLGLGLGLGLGMGVGDGGGGLVDDGREQAAGGDAQHQTDQGTGAKQDEHTAKGGGKDLARRGAEGDADTQLAQALADGIGGESEGAGDGEQEPKSARRETYCSRSRVAGSMRRARRTGPATDSEPVSTMVKATATRTKGSCAEAW